MAPYHVVLSANSDSLPASYQWIKTDLKMYILCGEFAGKKSKMLFKMPRKKSAPVPVQHPADS
jgi:hypothetical protein